MSPFCWLWSLLERWIFYTNYGNLQHIVVWLVACLLFIFCLMALATTDFSPFIYFRF